MNPYFDLTREFNQGGLRVIVSSGQAVVLLRLSIASKDGDWIVRETPDALSHVRAVLARHGARYRFGAPLDVRWLRGGWSSHLEFAEGGLRIRTDFVSRPPRLPADELSSLWKEQEGAELPCVDPRRLVLLKMTGRERDYPMIGEIARLIPAAPDRLLASRSPSDLVSMAAEHPSLARELLHRRPLLEHALSGSSDALEGALDAERRSLMRADVQRVAAYLAAARGWATLWPSLDRRLAGLPLEAAHAEMVERATGVLPYGAEAPG